MTDAEVVVKYNSIVEDHFPYLARQITLRGTDNPANVTSIVGSNGANEFAQGVSIAISVLVAAGELR